MGDSNQNNICNNPAFLNMLEQKRRNALNNVPYPRYNNLSPEINPYLKTNPSTNINFTKFDLDMRRKAEVLSYSGNSSDRFTNNLTNAQKWAQLVKGTSAASRLYSQNFIQQNRGNVICPVGAIIYTPTTASNVPGPVINLYKDTNVPVYNLVNHTNQVYGLLNINENIKNGIDFTKNTDILSPIYNTVNNNYTTFTSIFIYDTINPKTTFSFKTPISLQISNTTLQNLTNNYIETNAFTVSINKIFFKVLYSTSSVPFINPATSMIKTTDSRPEYSNSYSIQNPMNVSLNIPAGQKTFSLEAYLGVLHIDNIILPTSPGYIYDIQVAISYNFNLSSQGSSNYTLNFPGNSEKINTVLNSSYSSKFSGIGNNCSFNPLTVDIPYPSFGITYL